MLSFYNVAFEINKLGDILSIVKDKTRSVAKQWFDISQLLNPHNDKLLKNVFTAMQGNKIQLSKIWDSLDETEKEYKDELKEFKFSATAEKYDECISVAECFLSDEQLAFLDLLKQFYGLVQLDRVMSGAASVSEAMVARYNEHGEDLSLLKSFIKESLPKYEYNNVFRQNGVYANYIGHNSTHGGKTISHHSMCKTDITTITYDDFLKRITEVIAEAQDKDGYQALSEKIENKTLCKIHNTSDNAYIPYQLNEVELEAILERQKNNFPFLQTADTDGTVAKKIVSLLTFRIPYYVGPLSEKDKGKFAWIVKKDGYENAKVYPWNFEKVVDKAASGEQFITRMTAKCTYLRAEDVIPKQSLLYQRYMLLQDLNNLKINGTRICQELKTLLLNGLCQTETSLSKTKIKKYLIEQGKITSHDVVGKENDNDTAFNSSLSSLIKLRGILGDSPAEEMCENIIKWHTVFGDEKEPVKAKIKEKYGAKLTSEQINKLGKLSFKGGVSQSVFYRK